jgi:Leucine-rich repeat (LRR) protein
MATTADLAAYRDIQTLVLPNNELQDLSHLQHLHSLTHLDVTGNKLSTVLGFTLPAGVHSNLRVADFTSNQITELRDLSHFARLTHLTLDNNQLVALKGNTTCKTVSITCC